MSKPPNFRIVVALGDGLGEGNAVRYVHDSSATHRTDSSLRSRKGSGILWFLRRSRWISVGGLLAGKYSDSESLFPCLKVQFEVRGVIVDMADLVSGVFWLVGHLHLLNLRGFPLIFEVFCWTEDRSVFTDCWSTARVGDGFVLARRSPSDAVSGNFWE